MQLKKQAIIIGLLLVIVTSFATFEWTEFFTSQSAKTQDSSYPRRTKWFVSLLCSLFIWVAVKNDWNVKDGKRLRFIFLLTVLADTFLVLLGVFKDLKKITMPLGIIVFFAAHIMLVIRNTHGMRKWLSRANILAAAIIVVCSASYLQFILYPLLQTQIMLFIFGIFYMLVLSMSLWAAWTSIKTRYLPLKNAKWAAVGLTLFYLCDISVMFGIAASTADVIKPAWLTGHTLMGYNAWNAVCYIVHNITWLFYAPALFLIALSGYKTKLICYLEPQE